MEIDHIGWAGLESRVCDAHRRVGWGQLSGTDDNIVRNDLHGKALHSERIARRRRSATGGKRTPVIARKEPDWHPTAMGRSPISKLITDTARSVGEQFGFEARKLAGRGQVMMMPGQVSPYFISDPNAFITISSKDEVSFLNPSVRDYVASVLLTSVNDIEDLVVSMSRFRQGTALKALAETTPDSDLAKWFKVNQTAFLTALDRQVEMRHQIGVHVPGDGFSWVSYDMVAENRVAFLTRLAIAWRSAEAVAVLGRATERVVAAWADVIAVAYSETMIAIRMIRGSDWLMANGGKPIADALELGMAQNLHFAATWEFCEILDEHKRHGLMTSGPAREALDQALGAPLGDAIRSEIREASSYADLEGIEGSLEVLRTDFGLDVDQELERVRDRMNDYGEEREYRGSPGGSAARTPSRGVDADDGEIRRIFGAK